MDESLPVVVVVVKIADVVVPFVVVDSVVVFDSPPIYINRVKQPTAIQELSIEQFFISIKW